MSWWKIPTNPGRRDIEELKDEIFFPTKRGEDGDKIEWEKIPKWFFQLSEFYFDMLHDIDYHLCWDSSVDEHYFARKIVELNNFLPTWIYERALLTYVDESDKLETGCFCCIENTK